MRARCTSCQTVFDLPSFGRHPCPGCGAVVEVRDSAGANPYAAPAATSVPPPVAPEAHESWQPTPWERRGELGTFEALKQTVSQVLGSPQHFLKRTRWDAQGGDLMLLYFWVSVVPQWLGTLLGWGLNDPAGQLEQMRAIYETTGQEEMARSLAEVEGWLSWLSHPLLLVGLMVALPLLAYLTLFVLAGVTHVVLLALGKAEGGWPATLKVFVYASCTNVLSVVPSCGPLLAMVWAAVLQILGLSHAHRTTVGSAAAGVVGMHLSLICVFCGLPTIALVIVAGMMGG